MSVSAQTVISFVETELGLLSKSGYRSPVAESRLSLIVMKLRDTWNKNPLPVEITTQEGVGVYAFDDESYDKIENILWPQQWVGWGSTSPSHTRGSDITADVIGDGYGPKWVSRNEMLRLQQLADQGGVGSTTPYAWTHYRDNDGILTIQLADADTIAADLTITANVRLVPFTSFIRSHVTLDAIPVPAYCLDFLCNELAYYMARRFDAQRASIYRADADEEFRRIRTEHAITQFTDVKTTNHSYMPPGEC